MNKFQLHKEHSPAHPLVHFVHKAQRLPNMSMEGRSRAAASCLQLVVLILWIPSSPHYAYWGVKFGANFLVGLFFYFLGSYLKNKNLTLSIAVL